MEYRVRRAFAATGAADLPAAWDSSFWSHADTLEISHFHPASQSTHPATRARVLYDDSHLHLHFRVQDRCVRARYTAYQSQVCHDSCAEFFVKPAAGHPGYFNFEMNPIGTMLLYFVEDPTRVGEAGLKKFQAVPAEAVRGVRIYASEREPIVEESPEERTWWLQYSVPFSLFERYVGRVTPAAGAAWRGNFFKCADRTSLPHWAAWSPIGDELNFHRPEYFGTLRFE